MILSNFRLAPLVGPSLVLVFFLATTATWAAAPLKMAFVTHATFFSGESKQPKVLDPHVFVKDPAATAATGPQGIKHVAGLRPALIEEDAKSSKLYTASDKALDFDLGNWLGATGTVTITSDGTGKSTLEASFSGLRPGGTYSLFENHFDQTPVGFTPMDGNGSGNNFTAKSDGTASVSLRLPDLPTHANAVLLVFLHSDGQAHGAERGQIGVDAHHQLIARPE